MALAFDAFTISTFVSINPHSTNHTPVGTPKGVIVLICNPSAAGIDQVVGVTYGGQAMTRVRMEGVNNKVFVYFLGSGIPTGTQTVVLTKGSTVGMVYGIITITAGGTTTEVQDDTTITSASIDDPTATLSLGGFNCFCAEVIWAGNGVTSNITPLTNWTSQSENDLGTTASFIHSYDIVGSADVTMGCNSAAAYPFNLIGVAIKEGEILVEENLTLGKELDITAEMGALLIDESISLDKILTVGFDANPPETIISPNISAGVGHHLIFYDTTGIRQAVVVDFQSLSYVKRVNAPGLLQVPLKGDHYLLDIIQDKWEVEVWRKPIGRGWLRDFVGIFRDENWSYAADGSLFVMLCPGIISRLGWRIVNYAAGLESFSQFTNTEAETIAKTLVAFNAGPNATVVNGRKRDGVISGIAVQADAAGGNVLDWYCHGANLLETLQELAQVGGGDFDLYKRGANDWQFRWYENQLGTDRSATVKFSMELGNMAEPVYKLARSGESTVAAVYGQGEDADRDYVTRTGANYDDDDNDIEMFVDANDIPKGVTEGLNAKGDQALAEAQARSQFSFKAVETPSIQYGVDYYLGDLVTAINPFNGEELTQKVISVTVTLDPSGLETILPEFETPEGWEQGESS